MADKIISQLKLYYEQIQENFDETEIVTLNLEVDPQIQCVLAQRSDIGRVICRKELECFPIQSTEKPSKECQVEMEEVAEIKEHHDKIPQYSGVTYLPGDQVMLADYNYNRLLLLNSSYQYISCFTLPDEPLSTCVTDRQTVAVSIPYRKTIQFLSITSETIKPSKKVQTRYECSGVASAGKGNIIVSGEYDQDKCYWSLITSAGEEKCYQFDCQCSSSYTSVTLDSSCTRVYITVGAAHALYCFDMYGRMMYKYSHDNLMYPVGVTTDRDDNVYVVGLESDNIHQPTSDGTLFRVITDGIPHSPCAICFNNSRDMFLITNTLENKINMFRFK